MHDTSLQPAAWVHFFLIYVFISEYDSLPKSLWSEAGGRRGAVSAPLVANFQACNHKVWCCHEALFFTSMTTGQLPAEVARPYLPCVSACVAMSATPRRWRPQLFASPRLWPHPSQLNNTGREIKTLKNITAEPQDATDAFDLKTASDFCTNGPEWQRRLNVALLINIFSSSF